MPFEIKDHHKSLELLHEGTLPPHAYFIPYRTKEEARGNLRDYSSFFKTLIGEWDFAYFKSVNDVPDFRLGFDFKEKIEVPSNWQYKLGRGYDVPQYVNMDYPFPLDPPNVPNDNPAGLYSRDFTLCEDFISERDVILTFEGVDSCFYLFVNDAYAGYSQVSHGISEFDVTSLVHSGKNNVKVLVLKWCDGSYLEDQDMFRASGIFREVYLLTREKVRVEDIFLKCELSDDFLKARPSVEIKANGRLDLTVKLYSPEGALLCEKSEAINGEGSIILDRILSPVLWCDEAPVLYSVDIITKGEIIPLRLGIRKIEIKNGVVLINGKKVKVHGVNRHDSHPILGHATPLDHIRRDLLICKAANVNMVRTSHYPPDPRMLDMCDELGLYVCDEADIESHGVDIYNFNTIIVTEDEWWESFLDRSQRLLERDKNHPSIIMWSVGNECGAGINHRRQVEYFKKRDPSRLVHVEDESRRAVSVEKAKKEGKDIPYTPEQYREYIDIESRMYPSTEEILELYLDNPSFDKPLFLCEFIHGMGPGPGGIKDYIDLTYKYDKYFGGCVWELISHAVAAGEYRYQKPKYLYGGDFGDYPNNLNYCLDGYLTPDRKLIPAMLEYKNAIKPFAIEYKKGKLKITSRRLFTSLCDMSMTVTAEYLGRPVYTKTVPSLDILPGESREYELNLPSVEKGVLTLTATVRHGRDTEWAKICDEVGHEQFVLLDTVKERSEPTIADSLIDNGREYVLEAGEIQVRVDKLHGLITGIKFDGAELICSPVTPNLWRAPTAQDRVIAPEWRMARLDKLQVNCYATEAYFSGREAVVTASLSVAPPSYAPVARLDMTYRVSESFGLRVECKAQISKKAPSLPRFGFAFMMPEGFENIRYFGYGDVESYSDVLLYATLGEYQTTATDNRTDYLRPQENGAHFGCKWAQLSSFAGSGIMINAESFSFNASHFTCEMLENTAHSFELTPLKETAVYVDYRQRGIGSQSCGPAPKSEHLIDQKEISFAFNLLPTHSANIDPFRQMN